MNCSIPSYAVAGTQIAYTASKYSSDDYTLQVALNNSLDDPTIIDGDAADNGTFSVSAPAPTKPGLYQWQEIYTKTSDSTQYVGHSGSIMVRPSLLTKSDPTFNTNMVALLQKVLLEFASTTKASVSFNGQSFSRADIGTYTEQLEYYENRVKQDQAAATGSTRGGPVAPYFLPVGGCSHYPYLR